MKSILIFLFFIILTVGCTKSHFKLAPIEGSLSPTQLALMAQIWLLDSVKSDQPGDTAIKQANPKLEISFSESTYEVQFSSLSTPNSTFRYEIEGTNKMYYWLEANAKDNSKYFTIETLDDKSWVVSSLRDNNRIYE